ncbi:MAG: S-adenosylmethionine decarboxylase [Selenomonadaceae bacterium]|nr:S-adenosylmethionine decarboxylase [Selenomonadaceae bacterium]
MKILARHLTVDLYNCKTAILSDGELVQAQFKSILHDRRCEVLNMVSQQIAPDHLALMFIFTEGHVGIHVYSSMRYVAVDIFLCTPEAEPEMLARDIRNFFKPDKIKTTLLKRGDFEQDTEIKPKTKTRVAPLRKIHNTGAKVIRILARRNKK